MSQRTRRLDSLAGHSAPADYPLFLVMLVIVGLGLFMVFDASYARASQHGITHGDPWYFFKQQAEYAAVGLVALMVGMRLRYWTLSKYAVHAVAAAGVLLVLVMAPHIGIHSHGAVRWLKLGPIRLQPSEIAKICSVLYLAAFVSRRQRAIRSLRAKGLVGALIPVGILALLIIKEPDLGTALTLVATALVMLAVGGARMKHLAVIATAGFSMVAVLALSHSYSRARLTSFLGGTATDQTFSYQVSQSVAALEAGGIHGAGAGQGDAKFFHLPAPYTDFIGTTFGEEFGLIGSLLLLSLFFIYSLRGYHIAHRCPNAFGSLLATGLSTMVTIQTLLNLAVITRSVPDTGVPLPMISFGGSSLVLAMFSTGILLSISRWPDLKHVDALVGSREAPGSDDVSTTRTRSNRDFVVDDVRWAAGR